MGEWGVVAFGTTAVFGLVVRREGGCRLRVDSREWRTLNFAEGQTLVVTLPDGVEQEVLVAAVDAPPGAGQTWVTLTRPVAGRAATAVRPHARKHAV